MMIERMLKEIAPGGVFHAFGHDYVVLDHNFASVAGEIGVFCLDCGDVKAYSRFNPSDADDPNNYVDSELRDASSEYSSQLYRNGLDPKNALTFSVSLNELDGSYGYGSIQAEAAPLTLWQFGRYKHLLPKNVLERPFWLVTPWTRLPNTYGSRYACYVGSDGTANGGGVGNIVKCRPALLFHPETLVSCDGEVHPETLVFCDGEGFSHSALSGIPTDDLLKEISRRVQG